jgi:DNA-binding HxlR family transcriptional regulator
MKLEKRTKSGETTGKRWYDDACGTALALEFVGERWSLLIMRELAFGPRRFGEIRANLPGISANVLTQRLQGLEAAGILIRRQLPSPANVQVYELTPWGLESQGVMREMGRWATRSSRHDPMLFMSAASAMMSLQTLVNPADIRDMRMTLAFRFPDDALVAIVSGGVIEVRRGEATDADVSFTGDTMAFRVTIYGKAPVNTPGALQMTGDGAAAQRFIDLFRLPDKIA